jgi:hypothetical protein
MKLLLQISLFILLPAALLLAGSAVAGSWTVTATEASGNVSTWTLAVKEEGGRLSGTLSNRDGAQLALIDPTENGSAFSFKVRINETVYAVETKIDGNKMTGKFTGAGDSGTVTAVRQ